MRKVKPSLNRYELQAFKNAEAKVAQKRLDDNRQRIEKIQLDILNEIEPGWLSLQALRPVFNLGSKAVVSAFNTIDDHVVKRFPTLSKQLAMGLIAWIGAETLNDGIKEDIGIIAIENPITSDRLEGAEPIDINVMYYLHKNIEIAHDYNLPASYELMHDSPNSEMISSWSTMLNDFALGDYDGPIIARDEDVNKIAEATNRAEVRHRAGEDSRTIIEREILALIVDSDSASVSIDLRNRNDNIANKTAVVNEAIKIIRKQTIDQPFTAGDWMLLSQVFYSRYTRQFILDELFKLNQSGALLEYGISPISEDKIGWAKENHIDPAALIWAEATSNLAEFILTESSEVWYDGTTESERQEIVNAIFENGSVSPGAIAALQETETDGLTYIGTAPALSQINYDNDWYPTAEQDLVDITYHVNDQYNLNINPYTKPGSQRHQNITVTDESGNRVRSIKLWGSGGATDNMMMPVFDVVFRYRYDRARKIIYEKHNLVLPPYSPGNFFFMNLATKLWLGGNNYTVQGSNKTRINVDESNARRKGGAIGGDRESVYRATGTWNNLDYQKQATADAHTEYLERFGIKLLPKHAIELGRESDVLRIDSTKIDDGTVIEYLTYKQ